jgi:hypothetical protein
LKTQKEFDDWVSTAAVGERRSYHEGNHADGHRMKQVAATHAMRGKVLLFQNKVGEERYIYSAQKLSPAAGKVFRMEDPR